MWSPHLVRQRAAEKGIPPDALQSIESTLQRLDASGVVPILSLRHLCLLTGASYHFLRHVIGRSGDFEPYRHYLISKRTGGKRLLAEPHPMLSHVQRWLVDNVLNKVQVHPASRAFAPRSSIVACAAQHCGARWLVKLDVCNFFESISEVQVYHVFASMGYPCLVSFELSRLCSFPFYQLRPRYNTDVRNHSRPFVPSGIPSYADGRIGHLPQGAPTSPMLANLVCRDLDAHIFDAGTELGWSYTRYADDLTFSSIEADRKAVRKLMSRVASTLFHYGLTLNHKKTAVSPPGARKVVLGLLVDRDRPRLTQAYRRSMEAHLHFAILYGIEEHSRKRGFISPLSLLQHLQGKVAFALAIGDKDAVKWQAELNTVRREFFQHARDDYSESDI